MDQNRQTIAVDVVEDVELIELIELTGSQKRGGAQ